MRSVCDVKDIPSDDLAPQHKLVADLRLSQQKPQIKKSGPENSNGGN